MPSSWSLIPSGLSGGRSFRLIFLSSGQRNDSSTNIAVYNTFIQNRAAGNAHIQAYSDDCKSVGCTATVDA